MQDPGGRAVSILPQSPPLPTGAPDQVLAFLLFITHQFLATAVPNPQPHPLSMPSLRRRNIYKWFISELFH